MRGLPSILSLFRNEFNRFNTTRARILGSLIFNVKTLFYQTRPYMYPEGVWDLTPLCRITKLKGSVAILGRISWKITKIRSQHSIWVIIDLSPKRHLNGVSLAGRSWPAYSGIGSTLPPPPPKKKKKKKTFSDPLRQRQRLFLLDFKLTILEPKMVYHALNLHVERRFSTSKMHLSPQVA